MDTSANGHQAARAPHRPGIARALRKSVADAWLHLALFVAANVIWVILLGLPVSLVSLLGRAALHPAAGAAAAGMTLCTLAAGNAVLFHVTNRIAHGEASARDLLSALARHFAPSLALLLIVGAVVGLGALNVYFYVRVLSGMWWRVIGIMWAYLALMFLLAMTYSYPLLVHQRRGALNAMKRSALLFVDNAVYTLGLVGALVALTIAVMVPVVTALPVLVGLSALVLCFIEAGFVALAANNALLDLLRKYEQSE
jgi:uncharacterized membrane protein YesL